MKLPARTASPVPVTVDARIDGRQAGRRDSDSRGGRAAVRAGIQRRCAGVRRRMRALAAASA